MPSVGMRRTTRVFGVVKGGDSACVLRSGRRLWPESGEGKTRKGNGGGELVKKNAKQAVDDEDDDGDIAIMDLVKQRIRKARSLSDVNGRDRFFGLKYSRKRRRVAKVGAEDTKMFGLQFSRRKNRCLLTLVVNPSCGDKDVFPRFLFLVLRYVTRFGLTIKDFSSFVLSEPFCGVYASHGIQFLQGSVSHNIGVCQFFGITKFMPLLSVDFSAVPLCFKYLHSAMFLRSMFRSLFLIYYPGNVASNVNEDIDFLEFETERQSCNSFTKEASEHGEVVPEAIETNGGLAANASVMSFRLAGQNGQYRKKNSRCIKRRRTTLRKRKSRKPATTDRSNGALASDLKEELIKRIAGVASDKKVISLVNGCTTVSLSEANSARVVSTAELDSSHCSANILIAESDRCYRVEGAVVTSEKLPSSGEWFLVVKKDGLTWCTLKAERVMKSCSSNRYTHVRMFQLDNGWKLEFAKYQDWIVFKDLYKECSDRNVPAPVERFIPVPGVRYVSGYIDSYSVPFERPDAYISVKGDELFRAITRKTANYDMDSGDEEWLSNFNNEFQKHVSVDNFELIVDALEKAYYFNPDDCFDEKSAANRCQDLGSMEAVEAVCSYWMKKRKQKNVPLLRVYQSQQSKRAPLIPKPLLRKRRSFKRHPSQFGRGRYPSVWQAIAAEQEAIEEERNAILKMEEAKASANELKEFASQKRRKAEILMKNADLALYKATMLLRIAEAAQAGESVDVVAGHFLD